MTTGASAPQGLTLARGETELARWTISARGFALRSAVLLVVTMLILAPLFRPEQWWLTPVFAVASALFYMWVFDDFRIWTDNRKTRWVLSDRALYILGPEAAEPIDIRLPLSDIAHIRQRPPWSLLLRLDNGTAISLPLVPAPGHKRALIERARDASRTMQPQAQEKDAEG